ncbi:MAG: hypothetical protein N4A71_14355 [Carboxylicivirga sp.]|jgi:hypothetical protein|nr:hypothetical protein [Carboxylicivirga sp.]
MKTRIYYLIILAFTFLMSCTNDQDMVNPNQDFDLKVEELSGDNQTKAAPQAVQQLEWRCVDLKVNFYSGTKQVSQWDSYTNTMQDDEKQQLYRLENGLFTALTTSTQNQGANLKSGSKSYKYSWEEDGILLIDGVRLNVKIENGNLVIYYHVKDADKIGAIFNISIDNTFGGDLENEGQLLGMGVIRFEERNPVDEKQTSELSTQALVDAFIAQEPISDVKYMAMRKEQRCLILEGANSPAVAFQMNADNSIQLNNQRAQVLFSALLNGANFNILNTDLQLSRIAFDNNSDKQLLRIQAWTNLQQLVSFLYRMDSDEQSWIVAPGVEQQSSLYSYDLAQKFNNREKLLEQIFNTISVSEQNYVFNLSDGADAKVYPVSLKDNTVGLANVTPLRAKDLYTAFLSKQAYNFKGVDVNINKISHESGNGGSLLVFGVTAQTTETVKFYIDTNSDKEHWLIAPESANNTEIPSYELAQKFNDRTSILNNVFNTLKSTDDAYTFELSEGQDSKTYTVLLSNQVVDLANVTPQRASSLYTAFLSHQAYTFKGVDVNINRITHESGNGGSLLVFGVTTQTSENVKFYYDTHSDKEHWLIAPESAGNSEMPSYELAQKFNDRTSILNNVFNTLKSTDDAYTFELSEGQDSETHTVILSNQTIDLANVTPQRASSLYTAFLSHQAYAFKGFDVKINRITHESGNGGSLLVYGVTTQTSENVKFYFDTHSDKEHWLIAPESAGNFEIPSYELVQKFNDRTSILNNVFNTLKVTDDIYTFELSEGQDSETYKVQLSNQVVDLANITPKRAKDLYTAVLSHNTYRFLGIDVKINKITHESGNGGSLLVFGVTTQTSENVKFYYETNSTKEHWLIAPQDASNQ